MPFQTAEDQNDSLGGGATLAAPLIVAGVGGDVKVAPPHTKTVIVIFCMLDRQATFPWMIVAATNPYVCPCAIWKERQE